MSQNLIKLVSNVHVKLFLDGHITLPFQSIGSPVVHKEHNHIIKDNLKGINNNKLHKFFSKGLNCCENRTVNYKKS